MTPATFISAGDGVAREEALLSAGRPSVLLWRAEENALVVPNNWARREGFETAKAECARSGWPILLRSSGGGAVPQGPGTVNLAMTLPVRPGFVLEDGYREICGAVSEALARFEVPTDVGAVEGAFCNGAWNITANGRKLAGTAQRWRRSKGSTLALIHAAILLERPPCEFWPALERVHRAAGSPLQPRPDAHVALREILPKAMSVSSVFGALARAAEDRLSRISTASRQAA